jgi:hypothetical protein
MTTEFDQYLGKHLLVGITYLDHKEKVIEKRQFHGKITRITERGIFVMQANGEEFSLPPDIRSLKPAKPGTYRLRSTGEVVENPDFISTWTRKEPSPWKDR